MIALHAWYIVECLLLIYLGYVAIAAPQRRPKRTHSRTHTHTQTGSESASDERHHVGQQALQIRAQRNVHALIGLGLHAQHETVPGRVGLRGGTQSAQRASAVGARMHQDGCGGRNLH